MFNTKTLIHAISSINTAHIVFPRSFQSAILLHFPFLNLVLSIQAAPAYARCYLARRAGELE